MESERELARCVGFDCQIEDHGLLVMSGHFDYEGGSSQGLGYGIDAAFIMRLLCAVGVTSIRDLEGKSCWVTHTHDGIQKIEPLHKKDGEPFAIADWIEWSKKYQSPSAYEMRTGRKPR